MASEDFETIVNDFEILDDWEDRYKYLIDLGKDIPELKGSEKVDINKVEGCASQVWIIPKVNNIKGFKTFEFTGDSDAVIVKGLISVLMALYNRCSIDDLKKINAYAELNRLGLEQHLSSQRSNGLKSMIKRISTFSNLEPPK